MSLSAYAYRGFRIGIAMLALGCMAPAFAQMRSGNVNAPLVASLPVPATPTRPPGGDIENGRTPNSAVGRTGQRQLRTQVKGISPLARINSRIPNRLQNRLRNRIDRNYDPKANATSPFDVVDVRRRKAGQPNRR